MADLIYAGDAGLFKTCAKCTELKQINEFSIDRIRATGRNPYCRSCIKLKGAKYYLENREKVIATNNRWVEANPEKVTERRRTWRLKNPDYDVEWRKVNLEHNRALARARQKKQWESDPKARVSNAISCAIRDQITGKVKNGRKSFDLLGYTIEQLKNHLERLFRPGMTWDNYGQNGWEIDHIIPVSAHNFETPEDLDFRRCWALSNLQPLWASDNRSKQAKLSKPFQPSLALAA